MYNNLFKNYSKNYLQHGGAKAKTVDQLKLKISTQSGKVVIFGVDNDEDKVIYFDNTSLPANDIVNGENKYILRSFKNSEHPNFNKLVFVDFNVLDFFNHKGDVIKIKDNVKVRIGNNYFRSMILAQIKKQFNIGDAPEKKLAAPQLAAPQSLNRILVDINNYDVFDTLNPIVNSLPKGMVEDTLENRVNAALACIFSLARQLRETQNKLSNLQDSIKK